MEQLSIRQVAAWTGGQYEGPDLPIRGVCIDSRDAGRGVLFVALRGEHRDGHDFLGEAFASGAAAALVDRPEAAAAHRAMGRPVIAVGDARTALGELAAAYRRSLDLTVIGITGSNGKTTTKEMLRLLLGARATVSPKSFNNDLGVPLTLLAADRTHDLCVVEMGTNAPGEISALSRIARPHVGVVLNIAESHLQGLGSVEGVAREKFALVDALGPDGCAILNWDDPRTRTMIPRAPGYVLSFGTWPDADVFAGDVKTGGYSLSFKLFHKRRVDLRLIGVHNVHNALAALAVALWLEEDPEELCARLEAFQPAPMRMAVEEIGRIRLINDAYNANPKSVKAALHELNYRTGDRRGGRRVAILGDMHELGDGARALHARIGRQVARSKIDELWAIGPMSEATVRAARDAGLRHVHWSPDVATAMRKPLVRVRSGDVVLFKASRALRLERLYDVVKGDIEGRRRPRRRVADRA